MRVTSIRKSVLEVFYADSKALSHQDIEVELQDVDRVTLYRTLSSFEEAGVLHKVPDDGTAAKYALCHENCDVHAHNDNHVHFKCTKCGAITCLVGVALPSVQLPAEYRLESSDLLIQGLCPKC